MIGSPSNLEILLHCHYSPEVHPRYDAPAVREGLNYLNRHNMIQPTKTGSMIYSTTPKGQAFIEHLMTIPFPTQHWIVPNGQQ